MFLCEKRITYLSLFRDEVKNGNVGFVKFVDKNRECRMDLQLKKLPGCCDGSYPLYFINETGKESLGEIYVQAGEANVIRYFKTDEEKIILSEKQIVQREICGILIPLQNNCYVSGMWKEPSEQWENPPKDKVERNIQENLVSVEEKPDIRAAYHREEKECILSDDKWEQILGSYPQIHPFGDQRTFISMELKDFVILRAGYQKLLNNSFLLHGFYNYHHLILGPDMELGNKESDCFYVGVPGTYFEREKMVAVMFGFEGFECEGPVEIGKFGYYLRRVEL